MENKAEGKMYFIPLPAFVLQKRTDCAILFIRNNRVTGWLGLSFYIRWEVMRMKNQFDFNDLMQFGLFIIALLTFIYLISH